MINEVGTTEYVGTALPLDHTSGYSTSFDACMHEHPDVRDHGIR